MSVPNVEFVLLLAPETIGDTQKLHAWCSPWISLPSSKIDFLPCNALYCKACNWDWMMSLCLSVTLVEQVHIGWKSWKLVPQTLSLTPSLRVAQSPSIWCQGNKGEILGRLKVGWEKVACWSTKAAIFLKCVKIEKKLLWRTYRNSPALFRMAAVTSAYTKCSLFGIVINTFSS